MNNKIAQKIGLINTEILAPKKSTTKKLVTFVPTLNLENVRTALFNAGAGNIGNYANCSYALEGIGSFKANENANPFVGEIGKVHFEKESRLEVIFESYKEQKIIAALKENHPYEEVAYDLYNLENFNNEVGSGLIGELPIPIT